MGQIINCILCFTNILFILLIILTISKEAHISCNKKMYSICYEYCIRGYHYHVREEYKKEINRCISNCTNI